MNAQALSPPFFAVTPPSPPAQTRPTPRKASGRLRALRWAQLLAVRSVARAAQRISPELAAFMIYQLARQPSRLFGSSRKKRPAAGCSTSSLRVDNGNVRVYRWGTGPVVLCVHGWGSCAARMMAFVAPLVAAGYQVVAFDAPAHGASDGCRTDPIEFTRAIVAVARSVGPVTAVIGHSLGAATALLAIRDGGLQPQRVVLLSGYARFNLVLYKIRSLFRVRNEVVEQAFERLFRCQNRAFRSDQLCPVDALRGIDCPTLIVHDDDDAVVPIEHAEALYGVARSGTLLRTQGLGHHRIINDTVAGWCADFLCNPARFSSGAPAP